MKEYIISIDDLKRIIEGFSIGHELEPLAVMRKGKKNECFD